VLCVPPVDPELPEGGGVVPLEPEDEDEDEELLEDEEPLDDEELLDVDDGGGVGLTVCDAGGVVVFVGASGFAIGFGSAAATAGSASAARSASSVAERRRDRISAMIGQVAPRCKASARRPRRRG
jgi:hypothetical protein